MALGPYAFGDVAEGADNDFLGWDELRVIEQDGYPWRMYAADLEGDGRDDLVVVNLRNARLEIVSWQTLTDEALEQTATRRTGRRVNELPMAPDFQRAEFPLKQTPTDAAIEDLDGDGTPELYVLVTDPNRLLRAERVEQDGETKWRVTRRWELLPGRYVGGGTLLHLAPGGETWTALVSCDGGVQQLRIDPTNDGTPARAGWLEPRDRTERRAWWQADLDGDGQTDLVEWTNDNEQSLRWYRRDGDGLRPAQPLHDRPVNDAALLDHAEGKDDLLVLENSPQGVVRRYRLTAGESTPVGEQHPLALPGGESAAWASAHLYGQPVLFVADAEQPRVTLFDWTDAGWNPGPSFPVVAGTRRMVSVEQDGQTVVLFWPKEAGVLYRSAWADVRLTFAQPMDMADNAEERLILGLGRVGHTAWAVQKADEDLLLYRFGPGWPSDEEPQRFVGAAGKADEARWMGDAGLLVLDKFARGLRLVRTGEGDDEKAVSTEPAHLSKAKLEEFRVMAGHGEQPLRLARVTDGVLQWLDDDLQAQDQVMLPDGLRLADLTPNDDGTVWALQVGGEALHHMAPDDAGVLRVTQTHRLHDGRALSNDPHLGLLLHTPHGVTRLAEGVPLQLDVAESFDLRDTETRDATIHRVAAADVDGDGLDDAVFFDDVQHQLSVYAMGDDSAELAPLIAWPVFEDQSYPYGNSEDEQVREPRSLVALDFNGDGRQDLAMLSHDRLVIYLGRDENDTDEADTVASDDDPEGSAS